MLFRTGPRGLNGQREARAVERRNELERVAAFHRAQERAREERENAAIGASVAQGQG